MSTIAATAARQDLYRLIDQVNREHEPIEITSKRGDAALIARGDYESLRETAYLLRSPANARRLFAALEAAKAKRVTKRKLVDPE